MGGRIFKAAVILLTVLFLVAGGYAVSGARRNDMIRAAEMREEWILDGEAELSVLGEYEIKLSTAEAKQMTLWRPRVYEGKVEIEFDCLVPEDGTKLLLLVYGHGSDGTPVWGWKRDGLYDGYNCERMEVYTIAFNRGAHVGKKLGDQLANVRRIGGPEFAEYTTANFRKHAKEGRAFWEKWNSHSLLGGAREPVSGTGKYLHHRIIVAPPHIIMEVEGAAFADIVDHRAKPLSKGAIALRCMSAGRAFRIKNLVIKGRVAAAKE